MAKKLSEFEKYVLKYEQEQEKAKQRALAKEQGLPPPPPSKPVAPGAAPAPAAAPHKPAAPTGAHPAPVHQTPEAQPAAKEAAPTPEVQEQPKKKGLLGGLGGFLKKDKTKEIPTAEVESSTVSGPEIVVQGLKEFADSHGLETIQASYQMEGKEIVFQLSFSNKPSAPAGSDIKEVNAQPRYVFKKCNFQQIRTQFIDNLKTVFEF
ncbi:hypothetical protein [[Mycoplasma] testudinis]|uniref:hypothetical protein n=1 Tax=[Mycoplasma] testudinis TaxID=33924 RepID=UPI000488FD39|nr:hypothetical protein [[Mycoplasma] testudinis]